MIKFIIKITITNGQQTEKINDSNNLSLKLMCFLLKNFKMNSNMDNNVAKTNIIIAHIKEL